MVCDANGCFVGNYADNKLLRGSNDGTPPLQAQSGRILARSQFRSTANASQEDGPTGNLLLVEENGQQVVRAELKLSVTILVSPSSFSHQRPCSMSRLEPWQNRPQLSRKLW
jgi:hypothetical protein